MLEQVMHPSQPSKPLLDFVYNGGGYPMLLSEHATGTLEPFLGPNGILTQVCIRGDDRRFFAFTPRRILDVLDEARSKIKPTSYGRYLSRAAFKPYKFEDHDVFVVKGFEAADVFVTDAFVQVVGDAQLEGADFEPQVMSFDKG